MARQSLLTLFLLALGFACANSAWGAALSDRLASALARAALPVLQVFDPQIMRNGVELRSPAGWAIRVSAVCDGHGLVIALSAAGLLLRIGWRKWFWGIMAIQAFNLGRIIALGLALAKAPTVFGLLHDGVFPLATIALLALWLLDWREAGLLLGLALPLYALWLPLADELALPFVALANAVLALLPLPELGQIAERGLGWSMGSQLLAEETATGASLYLAPLRPADFLLALPLLAAAMILLRRSKPLFIAVPSLFAALLCGAITAVWGLASAHAPATLLTPDGMGGWLATPFTPPKMAAEALALVQNTLVHFNLLLLPLLIAAGRRPMPR